MHTLVPYKLTSLSKILAVSSVVMVELKQVTMMRPKRIQVKHTRRPNGVLGIRSPYLPNKNESSCSIKSRQIDLTVNFFQLTLQQIVYLLYVHLIYSQVGQFDRWTIMLKGITF